MFTFQEFKAFMEENFVPPKPDASYESKFRTPLLLKHEYSGIALVALAPKTTIILPENSIEAKKTHKGILSACLLSQTMWFNWIGIPHSIDNESLGQFANYFDVVMGRSESETAIIRGIQLTAGKVMATYMQQRRALTNFNYKNSSFLIELLIY